jgi:hypothetical protein
MDTNIWEENVHLHLGSDARSLAEIGGFEKISDLVALVAGT